MILGFIVDFLGNIFGYLLWIFFDAVSNYAVAITLFALAVNIIMSNSKNLKRNMAKTLKSIKKKLHYFTKKKELIR